MKVFKYIKHKLEGVILAVGMFLLSANTAFAVDNSPQQKLVEAGNTIKGILTALIVIVAGIAGAKVVIKYLPFLDDPQEKNAMWKALGTILLVAAVGGSLVWLVPWAYGLFS